MPMRYAGSVPATFALLSLMTTALYAAPITPAATVDMQKNVPVFDIDGIVNAPDGKPCAGAHVLWMQAGFSDNPQVASTNAQGKFHFPAKTAWKSGQTYGCLLAKSESFGMIGVQVSGSEPTTVVLPAATELHVRFLDTNGKPIAGAHVRPEVISMAGFSPNDRRICWLSPAVGKYQGGITNANGVLTLKNMPQGGSITIKVDEEQYAQIGDQKAQIKLANAASTDVKPITLSPAGSIEGKITNGSSGKGVAGADVSAYSAGDGSSVRLTAKTGVDGHYKILRAPAGSYRLSLDLPAPLKDVLAYHRVEDVYVRPGEHVLGANVSLIKGAVVAGKVTYNGTSAPAQGFTVEVLNSDDQISAAAATDAGGRYRLCIGGGNVNVSLRIPNQSANDSEQRLSVQDGTTTTCDFTTNPLPPPVTIQGHVVKADGTPAAGASVTAASVTFGMPRTVQADKDGAFSFGLDSSNALVRLAASLGETGTAQPFPAMGGDDVTLELEDNITGGISGVVTAEDGKPLAGATVNVTKYQGKFGLPAGSSITDAQGAFEFTGLTPDGAYGVRVHIDGYVDKSSEQISLQPGKIVVLNALNLTVADSFVAGRVLKPTGLPAPGVAVTAIINGVGDNLATTDPGGKFRISNLPHGKVTLNVDNGSAHGTYAGMAGDDQVIIKMQPTLPTPASYSPQVQPRPTDFVGRHAPEFMLTGWVNVNPFTLASLRGKFVLFDVWSCCSDRLKETQALLDDFGDRGIIGIGLRTPDQQASPGAVQAHLTEEGITMPVAVDAYLGGAVGVTAASLGVNAFESYALVDRAGNIAYAGTSFEAAVQTLSRLLMRERPNVAAK